MCDGMEKWATKCICVCIIMLRLSILGGPLWDDLQEAQDDKMWLVVLALGWSTHISEIRGPLTSD